MEILTLQAGSGSFDGSLDPQTGILALRLKCWAPDLLTAFVGAVPPIPATGLVENQARTVSRCEAGDAGGFDVQITLEGHLTPEQASPDSKDGTGVEYSLDGSTSEDPIDSHPNIRKLREIYQAEAAWAAWEQPWGRSERASRRSRRSWRRAPLPRINLGKRWTWLAI